MKPFSDVWYKPLPWCQFHFGSSQMFWWVPVCWFNIPPMPEPSSPVIIVTTCVLVRNARRWFWCNKRVGVWVFFFSCFSFKEREQLELRLSKSHFHLCSSWWILYCWALLSLECIEGRCTVHSTCCIFRKMEKLEVQHKSGVCWVGRFLSEGLLQVEVEVWMWSMLGLNTCGRENRAMHDTWQ